MRGNSALALTEQPAEIVSRVAGNHHGTDVHEFTLRSGAGIEATILSLGGILSSLSIPDRDGVKADIVLGLDAPEDYANDRSYFGTITGRVANRIEHGEFDLDGIHYKLAKNGGAHHLHGGDVGIDRVVWQAFPENVPNGVRVRLQHLSPDGSEGYPGDLNIEVLYTLTANELEIFYVASTNKATPVNLTNHSYFNLSGHDSGNVLNQYLQIAASHYTPSDQTLIPTGVIAAVSEAPHLDFTKLRPIGRGIDVSPIGYDHNYVIDRDEKDSLAFAAFAWDPASGRTLEVHTTEPGVQLYTAGHFGRGVRGKKGATYQRYGGFCLETQHYPNSINRPEFPSIVLRPGEIFRSRTVFKFGVKGAESAG